MQNLIENVPTADVLMTSMRSMGYSFEAAIADIIDNSITANATEIEIKFPINPRDCFVAICDNGCGMTKEELLDAMKYGSSLKREGREDKDLGRFGLGLKAASLSQCRKLTVVSKKEEIISAYSWNIDIVEEKKEWLVEEYSSNQIEEIRFVENLKNLNSGTIVLWESFDLIEKSTGNVYSELQDYQQKTSEYLSLIFHRFLTDENIKIRVNNFVLQPLDPFLENNKKTTIKRQIDIPVKDSKGIERVISIQPFILPFHKYLTDDDKKKSGGIENYRSKQGFYIYRNKRLIIWGTWFNRHRDELTKYARIRVDIPNSLDDIWGIDIKKQNASIPPNIKNRLKKAVDEAMDSAVKIQKFRGRLEKVDEQIDYIWERIQTRDGFIYKIHRDARIFDLLKNLDDETYAKVDMVLDEIEKSVPFQQIYIDKSQDKIEDSIDNDRMLEIEEKAKIIINMSISLGNDRKDVVENLFKSEPFCNYMSLKEKLL